MKKPKYLSPSALKTFKAGHEDYYWKYLSDNRPPRFPQTQAMAVGSAFDAYVKSALHKDLFGKFGDFEFPKLFEQQVEEQCRDFARRAGKECFDNYVEHKAYGILRKEIQDRAVKVQFENAVQNQVGGVTLLGKPDLWYMDADGTLVVYDWKVNGYCSQVSPAKGYIDIRPDKLPHKQAVLEQRGLHTINVNHKMEEIDTDWALQLSTYAWLIGAPVGGHWIAGIDQLAWRKTMRTARHRCLVGSDFQVQALADYQDLWKRIESGWFFTEMTEEESKLKQEAMDKGTDDWIYQMSRQ